MFCSKCGSKLEPEKKICCHCGNQVDPIKEKSKLDAYVDDVVGKTIKWSFQGIQTKTFKGGKKFVDWFLYGMIIVAFILYYFL